MNALDPIEYVEFIYNSELQSFILSRSNNFNYNLLYILMSARKMLQLVVPVARQFL